MTDEAIDPPIPEPDRFFDAVGRVVFAAAALEAEMAQLIVAIVHAPIAGILVNGEGYSTLRRHLQAVVDLPPAMEQYDVTRTRLAPDIRPRIRAELKALDQLNDLRNHVAHAVWMIDPGPFDMASGRPRRGRLLMPVRRFRIEELHRIARDIEAAKGRIERIGQDVDHRLYGLPEPPPA